MKKFIQLTGYSDPIYSEAIVSFNRNDIDIEVFILNRTTTVLKNVNIDFFSVNNDNKKTNLRLMDKQRCSYLMPNDSALLSKTIAYDSSKEFQLFGEISYQNNAGIIMGYLKTANISFDILEFLERRKIDPDQFRGLWQKCEWENKVAFKLDPAVVPDPIALMETRFRCARVDKLSIETSNFKTFCLYSKFVLGRDVLINVTVEEEKGEMLATARIRSQNMGAVVLIGKLIKKLNHN